MPRQDPIEDVEPFGVMVLLLCDERTSRHEPQISGTTVAAFEASVSFTEVHRDEGVIAAGASLMDRARHEFLARAGFAGDEHRCGRLSREVNRRLQCSHRGPRADELQRPDRVRTGTQTRVLRRMQSCVERPRDDVAQIVRVAWLEHVLEGAAFDGIHGLMDAASPCDDDERQRRVGPIEAVQELEPALPPSGRR